MDATSQQIASQTDIARSGRPWWKACCIGCLLLIIVVVVGGSLIVRMAIGPATTAVRDLPSNYPQDLQPYLLPQATLITYVPGTGRSRMMRAMLSPATFIAKLVGGSNSDQATTTADFAGAVDAYSTQLQTLDSVTVSWKNLQVPYSEAMAYYSDLFKRAGMTVQAYQNQTSNTNIVFAKRPGAAVQLNVTDDPTTPAIDDIELTVEYSVK
jgi:hypothetical protein